MAANPIPVAITDLNDDCLREIFLAIPANERIRLRYVCKKWLDIADDCWHEIKDVTIIDATVRAAWNLVQSIEGNPIESPEISGTYGEIKVETFDDEIIEGVMKRCGDSIKILREIRMETTTDSILPFALKYCRNIENLWIMVASKAEDKQLNQLYSLNRNIKVLFVKVAFKNIKICFRNVTTELLVDFSVETCTLARAPPIILQSQKHIVSKSNSLERLSLDCVDDELIEIIGRKSQLKVLELRLIHAEYMTSKGLKPIINLKNIRKLEINPPFPGAKKSHHARLPIDDEFLMMLSENLQLLEELRLNAPAAITDEGFIKLSLLSHLKKLAIQCCSRVTDTFLDLFSGLDELDVMRCSIYDEGVIKLLRKTQTMKKLILVGTFITNATIIAAIKETKKRENGILLKLYYDDTDTDPDAINETSPLLELVLDE